MRDEVLSFLNDLSMCTEYELHEMLEEDVITFLKIVDDMVLKTVIHVETLCTYCNKDNDSTHHVQVPAVLHQIFLMQPHDIFFFIMAPEDKLLVTQEIRALWS